MYSQGSLNNPKANSLAKYLKEAAHSSIAFGNLTQGFRQRCLLRRCCQALSGLHSLLCFIWKQQMLRSRFGLRDYVHLQLHLSRSR